ncbi:3-deoxy-7-phosphoheptulonate synthase [Streptomyces sp. NPDC050504]|uniref:3-deoxy-7-phosphoheptulonate synthase n=1 Tax=Streptomyces sp. NPDC050504 TaxID=3365618 RepID=UPI0037A2BD75
MNADPISRAAASWRARPAALQPRWPDPAALDEATGRLAQEEPLVSPADCDRLRGRLARAARGETFILAGGDCAETFDGSSPGQVRATATTLLEMAAVLAWGTGVPVVPVGRMAGQYVVACDRSTETRAGVELPAYAGDAVNDTLFTEAARTPDPSRLVRARDVAAATLAAVRPLTAEPHSPLRDDPATRPAWCDTTEFYVGHEALLLDYEAALTRADPATRTPYDLSSHLLWIGGRTARPDGAHVEFLSRVANPVALRVDAATRADDLVELAERLDPDRAPGRLTLIVSMGHLRVRDLLPPLIERVTAEGLCVTWLSDPVEANTFRANGDLTDTGRSCGGTRTCRFDHVLAELTGFFEAHDALGTPAGGIHLRFAGEHVTECLGGSGAGRVDALTRGYASAGGPRLNRAQAIDLAFKVADLRRGSPRRTGLPDLPHRVHRPAAPADRAGTSGPIPVDR